MVDWITSKINQNDIVNGTLKPAFSNSHVLQKKNLYILKLISTIPFFLSTSKDRTYLKILSSLSWFLNKRKINKYQIYNSHPRNTMTLK